MPNFGMVGAGGAAGVSQTLHDILAERYKAQLDQQEQDRQQQQLAIQQRSLGVQEENARSQRENMITDNANAAARLKIDQDTARRNADDAATKIKDQTQLRAYYTEQSLNQQWSPEARQMFKGYASGMPASINMADFVTKPPPRNEHTYTGVATKTGAMTQTVDLDKIDPATGKPMILYAVPEFQKPDPNAIDPHAAPLEFTAARPDPVNGNKADPRYGGLTPNSVWQGGIDHALRGVMPALGMGGTGIVAKKRDAIINTASAMATEAGTTLPELRAEYRANAAALGKVINSAVMTSSAAEFARYSLQRAQQASDEFARTGVPLVNKWYQLAANNFLDMPKLSEFEQYVYAAAREYAKVVTGGALSISELSVKGAEAVDRLLNAAKAPQAFKATTDAMTQEINGYQQNWVTAVNKQSDVLGRFLSVVTGRQPGGGMDAAIGAKPGVDDQAGGGRGGGPGAGGRGNVAPPPKVQQVIRDPATGQLVIKKQ